MKKERAVVGIDPGLKGACAVLPVRVQRTGGPVCHNEGLIAYALRPDDEQRLLDLFNAINERYDVLLAVIEEAHAWPNQRRKSIFTSGLAYGRVRMAVRIQHWLMDTVPAQVWQAALGLQAKGDKTLLLTKAKVLFHGASLDLTTADAALIAHYAARLATTQ